MKHAVNIDTVTALIDYDIICITGGEPLLQPDRTLAIISEIRRQNPKAVVYLYSALYNDRMSDVLRIVDGVHFTLHYGATNLDIDGFYNFQELISKEPDNKSFRLYIDQRVKQVVAIQPCLWRRIEAKPWISEAELIASQSNGLPCNETLFILKSEI